MVDGCELQPQSQARAKTMTTRFGLLMPHRLAVRRWTGPGAGARRSALYASLLLSIAMLSPSVAAAPQLQPQSKPQPEALDAAECEVWLRELSFARSVQEQDVAGFTEHLHPQAAFSAGAARPLRGRDTIVAAWMPIIEGERLRLSWYPTRVTIGGPADVAWSSGPALFESLESGAEARFSIGTFHSVWHRDGNGAWRVLFDEGAGRAPASAEQVAAFRAGRREDCPRG